MGKASSNRTRIRFYHFKLKTYPSEDPLVGGIHCLVGLHAASLRDIETVGIFHEKLSGTHKAKARADFIAEFGVNLVEDQRELPVRANFIFDELGNDLFVCWRQAELLVFSVFKS
jgi:hypothetical protein